MNKKLMAVAVASAFAMPSIAMAQVTMYGVIDVGYKKLHHTAADGSLISKGVGISEGGAAGNRIGFRGTEKLSNGLTAGFVIEQGLNITNGALMSTRAAAAGQQYDGLTASGNHPVGSYSTATNRQSYVSLDRAGLGELRLGYQYNNMYRVTTLNGYAVGAEGLPGQDLSHGLVDNANYGGTRSNGFTWISPKFSNFTATVQRGAGGGREEMSFGTAAGNAATNRTEDDTVRWGLLLDYSAGPLSASFAHTDLRVRTSAVATSASCPLNIVGACTATSIVSAAQVNADSKLTQLGASYVVGNGLKVVMTYADGDRRESVGATRTDTKALQFGAEYTMGLARPYITLGNASLTNQAGAKTADFKLHQVGIRYDLSKRTTAYAMHGTTKDSGSAAVTTTIAKRSGTIVGVAHSF